MSGDTPLVFAYLPFNRITTPRRIKDNHFHAYMNTAHDDGGDEIDFDINGCVSVLYVHTLKFN